MTDPAVFGLRDFFIFSWYFTFRSTTLSNNYNKKEQIFTKRKI